MDSTPNTLAAALEVTRKIARDLLIIVACGRYLGWW